MTALPGLIGILGLCAVGCSNIRPPDDYLGAVDGIDTWDPLFHGSPSGPTAGCLSPLLGYGPTDPTANPVNWYYLGVLSKTQMDIGNVTDPTRTPTPGAYVIDGCAPQGNVSFTERTDNFSLAVQYPVLIDASAEPTLATSYKPWFVQVPASVRQDKRPNIGCNDIKSDKSVQARGGYVKDTRTWGQGDNLDLDVQPLSGDQIRKADPAVVFKDWPMYNLGTPIMKAPIVTACPFATGAPVVMGATDASAMFQFSSRSWWRGLLGGYLDGGTVPIVKDPMACAAILPATNRCKTDGCICPQANDVYMQSPEVLKGGKLNSAALAAGLVVLSGNNGQTRTTGFVGTFAALPGQAGFSPVCHLRVYDPTKVTCASKEAETIAPRSLCTLAELQAAPSSATDLLPGTFIHCLFLQSK